MNKIQQNNAKWFGLSLVAHKVAVGMFVLIGVSSLVSWKVYSDQQSVQEGVLELSLEALPRITATAELGATLQVALVEVERMGAARTDAERRLAQSDVFEQMAAAHGLIDRIESLGDSDEMLEVVLTTMEQSIERLNELIAQRISATDKLEAAIDQLTLYNAARSAGADSTNGGSLGSGGDATLNFIVARTLESTGVVRAREIRTMQAEVAGLLRDIEGARQVQARDDVKLKAQSAEVELRRLILGPNGVFPLLRNARRIEARARSLGHQTRMLAEEVGKMAIALFDETNRRAEQNAQQFSNLLAAEARLLMSAGLVFVIAVMGVFAYFRLSIVGRLVKLNDEVIERVAGDTTPVHIGGSDEITDIANSISYFMAEIDVRQNALIDAIARAEKANASKSDFLANVSHDIRTPLTGIRAAIDLLDDSDIDEQQSVLLSKARHSAEILLALINDLLDMARLESDQLRLEPARMRVAKLTGGIVTMFEDSAAEKNVELSVRIDHAVPEFVTADFRRLTQIMFNLVGNALKFTDDGYVRVGVSLAGDPVSGPRFRLSVADSGVGIAESRQKTLFERFAQVEGETEKTKDGLGLGLAICNHLVGLMDGHIKIDSRPGEGATFTVDLPFVAADDAIETPLDNDQEEVRRSAKKILVAEDNEVNQLLIRKILESMGHEISIAENGEEAVRAATEHAYDVILMDIQMPVMDGKTATRTIRELSGPVASVPIIALTAHAMDAEADSLLEVGVDGIVTKPIDIEILAQAIQQHAAQRPAWTGQERKQNVVI